MIRLSCLTGFEGLQGVGNDYRTLNDKKTVKLSKAFVYNIYACVFQLAEKIGLEPVQYGFETLHKHHDSRQPFRRLRGLKYCLRQSIGSSKHFIVKANRIISGHRLSVNFVFWEHERQVQLLLLGPLNQTTGEKIMNEYDAVYNKHCSRCHLRHESNCKYQNCSKEQYEEWVKEERAKKYNPYFDDTAG